MADALNRFTKKLKRSINTPDFSIVDWIINPVLTAVAGLPNKYWIITGDSVSAMNQSEKDAVDLAETFGQLSSDRISAKIEFDVQLILKSVAEVIRTEINLLRAEHGLAQRTAAQFRTAVRNQIDES